jgi:tRNA (guanine-N7-)-methyltransferase
MTLAEKEEFFLRDIAEDQISFSSLFGDNQPVHIEIGSGRGEFLAEVSLNEPGSNFLGLEIKRKRIKSILRKLEPATHSNVRLLRMYVDEVQLKRLGEKSIERFYIFHPDPWPKRRHHKHRLIQKDFITGLAGVLADGGDVLITTDHEDYRNWIVKHFSESPEFEAGYPEGFSREPFSGHIETHFEMKLKQKGFPPFYMRFSKR